MSVYIWEHPEIQAYLVFFSCWCDIAFFANWTFMPILPQASSLASFFLQNLLTLCLFVIFWYFSQYFKLSHYYYFLCWSVNFNVITVCWMFWWLAIFSNQVFENWGMCIVFLNTVSKLQYSKQNFKMHRETKILYDTLFLQYSLYCSGMEPSLK